MQVKKDFRHKSTELITESVRNERFSPSDARKTSELASKIENSIIKAWTTQQTSRNSEAVSQNSLVDAHDFEAIAGTDHDAQGKLKQTATEAALQSNKPVLQVRLTHPSKYGSSRNQIIGIKEMDSLKRLKNRVLNIESAQ